MKNQHSNFLISNPFVALVLFALFALGTKHSQAAELPPVTGASYDGRQISWEPQSGAIGYNLYLGSRYHDTVVGVTSYIPELPGRYSIAAFDDNDQYSPWLVRINPDNVVQVDEMPLSVDAPENVRGTVYSMTAGEVFWDRLYSRSLEYRIFLNGAPLGSTTGSSFFVNALLPDAINRVSVVAETDTGAQSEQVVLEFNTSAGPFPDQASLLDNTVQTLRPDSPQNARITLYSADTAELFWDRPPLNTNIVATDIFRDGELLGTNNGTSFYDTSGDFSYNQRVDSRHKYELVAINADGERSLPAVINPGVFDGARPEVVQRLLTGITDVTTNNAHVQWFSFLQNLAFGNIDGFAEQLSVENIVEDGFLVSSRTEYNCLYGGSLSVVSVPTAIINTDLTFDFCSSDVGEIHGKFALNGLDAGGYTATYDNLGIDSVDTMFGMDGVVELSIGRGFGNRTLSYQEFRYSTYTEHYDDDGLLPTNEIFTNATLDQQVIDSVTGDPRTSFTTSFTANGSWTNERDITVSTVRGFEDAVFVGAGVSANYMSGELLLESEDEADRLILSADTGDAGSWSVTITDNTIEGVITKTMTGAWDENVRLPCISAFGDDVDMNGCAAQ
ncbi:MAG: hypothetical protein AB8B84_13905 [Granulosicoccus sp.]